MWENIKKRTKNIKSDIFEKEVQFEYNIRMK